MTVRIDCSKGVWERPCSVSYGGRVVLASGGMGGFHHSTLQSEIAGEKRSVVLVCFFDCSFVSFFFFF